MNEIISASVQLINDKVMFEGRARNHTPVIMDYHPPLGDDLGYTGLEMLLVSLSGCSASVVVPMLRKMRITVNGFEVKAVGNRRDTHPTVLTDISLKFILHSPDATKENLEKAIKLAEDTYCPVWAMLKGNVEIKTELQIISV
jgi:putative redox protein